LNCPSAGRLPRYRRGLPRRSHHLVGIRDRARIRGTSVTVTAIIATALVDDRVASRTKRFRAFARLDTHEHELVPFGVNLVTRCIRAASSGRATRDGCTLCVRACRELSTMRWQTIVPIAGRIETRSLESVAKGATGSDSPCVRVDVSWVAEVVGSNSVGVRSPIRRDVCAVASVVAVHEYVRPCARSDAERETNCYYDSSKPPCCSHSCAPSSGFALWWALTQQRLLASPFLPR